MEAVALQDEQALRAQLRQARERLDGLVRDLRAIDHQLEGLSGERKQYRLLGDVCGALDELRAQGAAALFWGERGADSASDECVRLARGRLDSFAKRVGEIEDRRQAVFEEIQRQQDHTELLEDDVLELERQEEQRKLEWIVERDLRDLPTRESVMPWTRGGEEDDRFRKALAASLLMSLLLGLVLPQIDLPLPERWEAIEVPERLTRLIREELPPPPPVAEVLKPEEPKPLEEEPQLAKETAPEPAPPKESAASKGILAFREKFSGLADSQTTARLGSQARITSAGAAAAGRPERSMVTTQAPGSSGGINLAALSRDVGGGGGDQLTGVQIARATSSIGGVSEQDRPLAGGPPIGRTDEEIQIVFDRHKAGLYRLYNRELRRDPTLKGQLVLRLRIEPDGSVSLCALHASDLGAPQLSAQVVERVRTFDFGAKDVPAVTILYPIDFLPAT